jgi:hypothetical protein
VSDGWLIPLEWPRGPLRRWLAALATVAALLLLFYLVFSWLGWGS